MSENWLEEYKKELAQHEGSRSRKVAIEGGGGTRGFGITSISKGLKEYLLGKQLKADEISDRDLFNEYVNYEAERAAQDYIDVWPDMPISLKKTVIDLYFNAGGTSGFPSFNRALKAGNYQEAAKQTLDIVSANDPKTGESAVLRGLANRRVDRYNEIANEVGFDRINDFSITPSDQEGKKTTITYQTDSDTIAFNFLGGIHSASGSYDKVKKKPDTYQGLMPDIPSEDDAFFADDYDDTEPVSPAEKAAIIQEVDDTEITADDVEVIAKGDNFATSIFNPFSQDNAVQRTQEQNESVSVEEGQPANLALINPNGFQPRVFDGIDMSRNFNPSIMEIAGAQLGYNYAPALEAIYDNIKYGNKREVGYLPTEDMEGYEAYQSHLINAQNPQQMADMKRRLDENKERRQLLYDASFGKSIVAGFLDPINLVAIPFTGGSSLLASGIRSGIGVAAVQSGLEVARLATDPLATGEEAALNIGGAFVAGTALGTLFSIPSARRAYAVRQTSKQIEETRQVIEDAGLTSELLKGASKDRPHYNVSQESLTARIKNKSAKTEFFVKMKSKIRSDANLDEIVEDLDLVTKFAAGDKLALARVYGRRDAQLKGVQEQQDAFNKQIAEFEQELKVKKKEVAQLEQLELAVPDPVNIVENAFTKSWLYKGISTPVKRTFQSKVLPTSVKLDMLRLAGDSGTLLNMNKAGLNAGSSVNQNAQLHNAMWGMRYLELQKLWGEHIGSSTYKVGDYSGKKLVTDVKGVFSKDEVTFDRWLEDLGEAYVTGRENLTPAQKQGVEQIRSFFKEWEEKLRSVNMIGNAKATRNKVFNLESDIKLTKEELAKLPQEDVQGQPTVRDQRTSDLIDRRKAKLARQEEELKGLQELLEQEELTPVLPAGEEDMFPRFWDKPYIEKNRAKLEQTFYDHFESDPYVFAFNKQTGKKEKIHLDDSEEALRKRAKESVDEILGISDVADDQVMFFGAGQSKHLRHRKLNIPNAKVSEFIYTNPMDVMRAYTARIAPKYEFNVKFGGRSVEDVLDDMTERMYESGMTTRQVYAARKDFLHMYDRVVGSVLKDPSSMSQRIANVMRFAAETNYLGSAGFSTLPDAAKIIMEHEMGTVTKALLTILDNDKVQLNGKEGRMAGELTEIISGSSHMRMVEDLMNNPLERGILDKGRDIAYTLNALAPMTNAMKKLESLTRGHSLIDMSIRYTKNDPNNPIKSWEIEYLARYNIDKSQAAEIANAPWDINKSGLYLPNSDIWEDAIQFPATEASVVRGPTGKFTKNSYTPVTYNKKTKTITIDADYINSTTFPAKAWMREGLDANAFKSAPEYINYLQMREVIRSKFNMKDVKAKSSAEYAKKISDLAMQEMKRQKGIQKGTVQNFRQAMNSGIMNTIIQGTPADKPIITDGVAYIPYRIGKMFGMKQDERYVGYSRIENGLLGLPFQFYSYSLGAANKITAAYSHGQIRGRASGLLASIALGYISVKIKTPDWAWEQMEYSDRFARAVDASGVIALYSDMFYESLAMSASLDAPDISAGLIQPKMPPSKDDPFSNYIGLAGAGANITYDLGQGAYKFVSGDYGEGGKQFVRNLPYMRLWFLKDQMNEVTRGWSRY